MLKTLKKPLGITFGALSLLALLYFLLIYQTRQQRLVEARQFVDRAIPEIAATWSPEELRRFSSGALIAKNKQMEQVLVTINDLLGPMKTYGGSRVKGTATERDGRLTRSFIVFEVKLECEDGPAELDVAVTWEEGGWRLSNFFVRDAKLGEPSAKSP